MNILFLLNRFPKISETFILNQVIGLHNLGINIDILALDNANEDIRPSEFKDIELSNKIFYFDNYGSCSDRIYSTVKILAQSIGKDFNKYRNSIKAASCQDILLTNKLLSLNKNYDIIHAHFGNMGISAAKLKKYNVTDAKIITSFYGYDTSLNNIINNKSYYELLINNGDLFLPLSNFMKKQLTDMSFQADRIIVHKLGIDTDKFRVSKKPIKNKIKLLSIARLVEKKGLYYSINAFKKIINRFNKFELEYNIIGDGELKYTYKKLIKELNLENKIILHGTKTQQEIINYINQSHILIHPSIISENGDMEGTPVSIMEAMASALPVISTYHSGIPELIKNGVSGFLVPEKDVDKLAEMMLYVINNPEKWKDIGLSARKFIEENHNIKILNKQLISLYENLLHK